MKTDKLIDAIGMIDDTYIKEAHEKRSLKNIPFFSRKWVRYVTAAVCVCLMVMIIPQVFPHMKFADGGAAPEASNAHYGGASYAKDTAEYDGDYYAEPSEAPSYEPNEGSYEDYNRSDQNSPEMPALPQKRILTANMSLETQELDGMMEKITGSVNSFRGYLQQSSVNSRGSYTRIWHAVIRIPADSYQAFLDSFKEEGNVTYYEESVRDITNTYTDLSARLASYRAQEAKVLEFYEKAETIEDLMAVEERLSDIRYEIEYLEAQIKNYDLLVAYSTLDLTVTETKEYTVTEKSFFEKLGDAFRYGWQNFIGGIEDFFLDFVYYIWTIVAILVIGFIAFRIYRKIRNRRA